MPSLAAFANDWRLSLSSSVEEDLVKVVLRKLGVKRVEAGLGEAGYMVFVQFVMRIAVGSGLAAAEIVAVVALVLHRVGYLE